MTHARQSQIDSGPHLYMSAHARGRRQDDERNNFARDSNLQREASEGGASQHGMGCAHFGKSGDAEKMGEGGRRKNAQWRFEPGTVAWPSRLSCCQKVRTILFTSCHVVNFKGGFYTVRLYELKYYLLARCFVMSTSQFTGDDGRISPKHL